MFRLSELSRSYRLPRLSWLSWLSQMFWPDWITIMTGFLDLPDCRHIPNRPNRPDSWFPRFIWFPFIISSFVVPTIVLSRKTDDFPSGIWAEKNLRRVQWRGLARSGTVCAALNGLDRFGMAWSCQELPRSWQFLLGRDHAASVALSVSWFSWLANYNSVFYASKN